MESRDGLDDRLPESIPSNQWQGRVPCDTATHGAYKPRDSDDEGKNEGGATIVFEKCGQIVIPPAHIPSLFVLESTNQTTPNALLAQVYLEYATQRDKFLHEWVLQLQGRPEHAGKDTPWEQLRYKVISLSDTVRSDCKLTVTPIADELSMGSLEIRFIWSQPAHVGPSGSAAAATVSKAAATVAAASAATPVRALQKDLNRLKVAGGASEGASPGELSDARLEDGSFRFPASSPASLMMSPTSTVPEQEEEEEGEEEEETGSPRQLHEKTAISVLCPCENSVQLMTLLQRVAENPRGALKGAMRTGPDTLGRAARLPLLVRLKAFVDRLLREFAIELTREAVFRSEIGPKTTRPRGSFVLNIRAHHDGEPVILSVLPRDITSVQIILMRSSALRAATERTLQTTTTTE